MSSTPRPTKRAPRKTTQTPKRASVLNDSLRAMPLDEALEVFLALDADWSLIPDGHEDQLASDWDLAVEGCGSLGIATVHGLLTELPAVLTAATGVPNVTGFHTGADQALLHRTRNAALAVAVATAPNHDPAAILDTTRRTLRARTSLPARALVDDEITLLRTVAAVTACGAPTSQRVGTYALCDAGMLCAETTSADVSDIDGPLQQPTAILASGTASGLVSDRLVPLEAFHRRALARRSQPRSPAAPRHCSPTSRRRTSPGPSRPPRQPTASSADSRPTAASRTPTPPRRACTAGASPPPGTPTVPRSQCSWAGGPTSRPPAATPASRSSRSPPCPRPPWRTSWTTPPDRCSSLVPGPGASEP